MVAIKLYKKGVIINKTPDVSDIYYAPKIKEYFIKINKIHGFGINILINLDNDTLNNLYIKQLDKTFYIYDMEDTSSICYVDDCKDTIYNSFGDRIFYSSFFINNLNNNDDDDDNQRIPSPIIPFGVIR